MTAEEERRAIAGMNAAADEMRIVRETVEEMMRVVRELFSQRFPELKLVDCREVEQPVQ